MHFKYTYALPFSLTVHSPILRLAVCEIHTHVYLSIHTNLHTYIRYMYSRSKKTKHPYLFQYKLSYRNETGNNHYGLVSTPV